MLESISKWLIKRNLKSRHMTVDVADRTPFAEFKRVKNTLRENKIMVITQPDGIYIRLAGNEHDGFSYSDEFVKVKSFDIKK